MKLVIAVIQPDMLDTVREELIKAGITRITSSRCSGRGKVQKDSFLYRGQQVAPDLSPKVRLEIACNNEFLNIVVDTIMKSAKHGDGKTGDGKIFVLPLEKIYRISTGEEGPEAI